LNENNNDSTVFTQLKKLQFATYFDLSSEIIETYNNMYRDDVSFIKNKIAEQEMLLKIINPKDFESYIRQLADYDYRPEYRDKSKNSQYKFVHLSGSIVPITKKQPKTKPRTHTKKNSTTLLSDQLITPVFGQHHSTKSTVGLLFDWNKCNIKAMLRYDRGTYLRQWVGSRQQVIDYKNLCERDELNFTRKKDFQDYVKNSDRLNEVLAEISRDALLGIVFCKNSDIGLALHYHETIQQQLGINLPIFCYDNQSKMFRRFYPKILLSNDNTIQEQAKLRLISIKQSLKASQWEVLSLFANKKSLPRGATQIIADIDSALKQDNFDYLALLQSVQQKLIESSQAKFNRSETTRNSYHQVAYLHS